MATKTGTVRDRDLWDRLVNERFGSDQPILSPEEIVLAARKLYRHAMGKSFSGKVKLTSGRRYTWIRSGVLYVNPDKREPGARGLRAMIHDLSHYCHGRLHPDDAPHSRRQAQLEGRMAKFALQAGFVTGALKRPERRTLAKPDKVQQRYEVMVSRRDKWAKAEVRAVEEVNRSARLRDKADKEVRAYERRHGCRLGIEQ